MAKLQTQDVDRRRMDLQDRGSQLEEQLRGQIAEKDDLVRRKEHLEEDILELDIAYQKAYGQMGKSADWKLEVGGGQDELK